MHLISVSSPTADDPTPVESDGVHVGDRPPTDGRPIDDVDRLRLVLLRLTRMIRANSPDELTPSQLSALGTIARNGPVSISAIAQREHVQPPTISKIVSTLEERGLVARETDPNDRRTHKIDLTVAGRRLVGEIRSAQQGWLYRQLAGLDDDDRTVVMSALGAFERLLKAEPR